MSDEIFNAPLVTSPEHTLTTLPLREISGRPLGDTRDINIEHAFELARSIEQVGLIEPIVVDLDACLLAGGHRLAALKLLNPQTRAQMIQELTRRAQQQVGAQGLHNTLRQLDELRDTLPISSSFDFERVLVRVFPFSSIEEPNLAIEVEISENAQRRDYAPSEVFALYQTLLAKGYTDVTGRPRQGEKAVTPMIATIIGQSTRTVKRKLKQAMKEEQSTPQEQLRDEALKVIKSVQRLKKQLQLLSPEVTQAVRSSIEWRSAHEELITALACVESAGVDDSLSSGD